VLVGIVATEAVDPLEEYIIAVEDSYFACSSSSFYVPKSRENLFPKDKLKHPCVFKTPAPTFLTRDNDPKLFLGIPHDSPICGRFIYNPHCLIATFKHPYTLSLPPPPNRAWLHIYTILSHPAALPKVHCP
jgi:hypothetical protein